MSITIVLPFGIEENTVQYVSQNSILSQVRHFVSRATGVTLKENNGLSTSLHLYIYNYLLVKN